ncbi:MAG TPA: hypothetical protein QF716_04790 [Candidatus Thalassarchaeaceae archaeon]|jgi:hypothetical protein|nr:hypothetical protein [Candidatus Thalassarchaeaceae archaeon]HJM68174.1 hypothetical protein [Candidatus Thalassarchaeaceae archaeon]
MDIKKENNENTKQAREIQKMVMQLIQLWIPTLEDELHGQKSALRSRAMKLMGLWITRLEFDNAEDLLRKEIREWENENNEMNCGVDQYDWDFWNEHV